MLRVPEPETKKAYLVPSGELSRPTLHVYDGYREVEALPLEPGQVGTFRHFEYLYRCTETGTNRRWGSCSVRVLRGDMS